MSETSEQNGLENSDYLCRFCGLVKVKNRHIFHDAEFREVNFLHKINSVYPNILIYDGDPLPKFICENCEIFVHSTYERLATYQDTHEKLCNTFGDPLYRKRWHDIQGLQDKINDLRRKASEVRKVSPLKLKLLLSKKYNAKSLQQLCIDFFNTHGSELLDTVLRINRNLAEPDDDDRWFMDRMDEVLQTFPRKPDFSPGREDSREPSEAETDSSVMLVDDGMERKRRKRRFLEKQAAMTEKRVLRTVTGAKKRISYVDDIPDSVLFYEDIQEAKRRRIEEKVIAQSLRDAQRAVINLKLDKRADMKTQVTKILKTNPGSVVQFNSAVSIKLARPSKPLMEIPSVEMCPRGFNPEHLLPPEVVFQRYTCVLCHYEVPDLKALAIHNNIHLRLKVVKIGEKKLLPPQFRKGRHIKYMVRCCNCLMTFANLDFIKQHWIAMACSFYCKICYMDFHSNPEDIKPHMLSVHGINVCPNVAIIRFHDDPGSSSFANDPECKLKIKSVSSINASSSINGLFGMAPPVSPPMISPPHVPPSSSVSVAKKHAFSQNFHPFPRMRPPFHPRMLQYQGMPHQRTPIVPQQQPHPSALHLANQARMLRMYHHQQQHHDFYAMSRPPGLAIPPRPGPLVMPYGGLGIVPEPAPISHSPNGIPTPFSGVHIPFFSPCGMQCMDKDEFIVHRKECKDCRFSCIFCVKGFQTGSELQMHLMLSHPKTL